MNLKEFKSLIVKSIDLWVLKGNKLVTKDFSISATVKDDCLEIHPYKRNGVGCCCALSTIIANKEIKSKLNYGTYDLEYNPTSYLSHNLHIDKEDLIAFYKGFDSCPLISSIKEEIEFYNLGKEIAEKYKDHIV